MGSSKENPGDLVNFARSYTRSRIGLFFGLAFPVILILLFGAIFSGSGSAPSRCTHRIRTTEPSGPAFLQALNETGTCNQRSSAHSQNFSQYLLVALVLGRDTHPAELPGRLRRRQPRQRDGVLESRLLARARASVGRRRSWRGQRVQPARANGSFADHRRSDQLTIKSQSYKYIDFLIPGMIGFAMLVSPMFALVNISSQYKRDKIFKQLSLTPLTKTDWLISKILFYFVITIASFLLMSAFGIFAFGAHISFSIWIHPVPSSRAVPLRLVGYAGRNRLEQRRVSGALWGTSSRFR